MNYKGIELPESDVDPWTGTPLTPGDVENCLGNGKHEGYEICCDECPYLMACVPEVPEDIGRVEYKGCIAEQASNHHIMIWAKDGSRKMHVSATRPYTDQELRAKIELLLTFSEDKLANYPDAPAEI